MATSIEDQAAREVVAMQFAGGISIARLAEDWERDTGWVEEAIRQALLVSIPKRDGGLKASRTEVRSERRQENEAVRGSQETLWPEN